MANICVFTQTLLAGGAEKDAVLLANSLVEKHRVYLLVYYGDRIDTRLLRLLNNEKVELIKLHGSLFSRLEQMCRLFRKKNIDILFSMLLLPNFAGGILGRICGVKFPIGGIKSAQLDKSKVLLNRLLQNHVNKQTIYNNYRGFNFYSKKGFNPKRAMVIPNSLEKIPEPILRDKSEPATILSVGRFHAAKDYLTALKAVKLLKEKGVKFQYVLIGYGDLESEIRKWISELELEAQIQVIINPENLDEYYRKADMFLMSSIFEGLPNAVLEAMSYSLPVVATRVGDLEILVLKENAGFLCEPKDSVAMAEYLEVLIENYGLRTQMGQKAYKIVKKEYSPSVSGARYLELIDSLLET